MIYSFIHTFWVAHTIVLPVTASGSTGWVSYFGAWLFSFGMWLRPRRCGRGQSLAVCTNGLLRAATCQALCVRVADSGGRVHGEKADDGLRAGGCKCRADDTPVLSLTPGRRRGGQRSLNTRLGKKKARLQREHTLYFGKVFF